MAQDSSNPLDRWLARLGLPTEQFQAVQKQISQVIMPTEQVQAMRDLMKTFSPANVQLGNIDKTLKAQRAAVEAMSAQLEAMMSQLDEMEATVERLNGTAEQLWQMQEPFTRFSKILFPGLDTSDDDD